MCMVSYIPPCLSLCQWDGNSLLACTRSKFQFPLHLLQGWEKGLGSSWGMGGGFLLPFMDVVQVQRVLKLIAPSDLGCGFQQHLNA